ncbi:hypothetical protein GGR56DRAFT_671482 [Xylariaceae sp. FL0804]|nr:hypothetical protein GGR56DRAFT_671482 [Xylariaceae sp. FL0804]
MSFAGLGTILVKISDVYTGFYALAMRLHLVTYDDLKFYETRPDIGNSQLEKIES